MITRRLSAPERLRVGVQLGRISTNRARELNAPAGSPSEARALERKIHKLCDESAVPSRGQRP